MQPEDVCMLMAQEYNKNTRDKNCKTNYSEKLNKRTNMKLLFSQTPYETSTTYKPGDTFLWIRKIEKYKKGSINDMIGRRTGIKIRFKSRKPTVITVYQLPEGSKVKETKT
jgi:hypothetical protein